MDKIEKDWQEWQDWWNWLSLAGLKTIDFKVHEDVVSDRNRLTWVED